MNAGGIACRASLAGGLYPLRLSHAMPIGLAIFRARFLRLERAGGRDYRGRAKRGP
jgi:hypothetical protein